MLAKLLSSPLYENNRIVIDIVKMKRVDDVKEKIHFIVKDDFNHFISEPFSVNGFFKVFKEESALLNHILKIPQFVELATINNDDYNNPKKGDVVLKSNIDFEINGFESLKKEKN